MCASMHACGFVLARLKSNCLSEVHSALRVLEQDHRPLFPASPIVPTLDLDNLIGPLYGARKESMNLSPRSRGHNLPSDILHLHSA